MKWTPADMPSMKGKVAVITGANSGLGLHTTIGLAQAGARVVMACRNPDKAGAALHEIKRRVAPAWIETMELDLADLSSISRFASAFGTKYQKLDLLCNNAGVMAIPHARTKDGFEMQIGTNHFGHFALTGMLLDKIKAAPQSRVINVASIAHKWTDGMDLKDVNFERKPYRKWDAYGKSKLANLLFTFALNRHLAKSGATTVAVASHPGYSDTNLQFVAPQIEQSGAGQVIMRVANAILAQPASMGALPTLYAASMPDVQGGDYIGPNGFRQLRGYPTKVRCSALSQVEELQERWWALSETLTRVSYSAL